MEELAQYFALLKKALERSTAGFSGGGYLDLARNEHAIEPGQDSDAVPQDNLVSFHELMMDSIAGCRLDKIKIGVNELLKHLLRTIDRHKEAQAAELFLNRLRMVFKRCLMPDFPFAEEVWNYICECLRSTGVYLAEHGYYDATREVIDSLAGMGRIAALHGLPTANTQSALRILENKALAKDRPLLAAAAKNARFNLET